MKKLKKCIALLLVFVFCASIIPSSIFAESVDLKEDVIKEEISQTEEDIQLENNEAEKQRELLPLETQTERAEKNHQKKSWRRRICCETLLAIEWEMIIWKWQ